jgi:teichuronic acid biosynthesis glycosyltransferase TuaC
LLVVTLLYPLPTNVSRGVFVEDHVKLLREAGHEVRVINPLPWMPKFAEARRSTLAGVSKAPRTWVRDEQAIFAPRFFALPDHPYPSLTRWNLARKAKSIERFLGDWRPDAIVCHTLWPVGVLAERLAKRWNVPWTGVVHGYDFDVALQDKSLGKHVRRAAADCDALVCATGRLNGIAAGLLSPPRELRTIPCSTEIGRDWARELRSWRGRWRKDALDILFPADPRRPEKQHLLALETGEEMEHRGWVVGVTHLKQQPRHIVHDRMMVADVTLITSKREAGPLVARESLLCGTPVVSVDVGEVATYLPETWVCEPTPSALADGIEAALREGWTKEASVQETLAFASNETVMQAWNELLSTLVEQT